MAPPKYDHNRLNNGNQFLRQRGSMVTVHRKDIDRNPTDETLQSYCCTGSTNVPFEILNTGNTDVLNRYLSAHGNELNKQESSHLRERIEVMNYLGELEKYYQQYERESVGPMIRNSKGQKVLPGIVMDREQDTTLGCWSCAFSMLLKGRGVELDQKIIRRYRPEFVEGNEIKSPQQTDIINSNEMSEIYQYSSLVDKVCPNTKMCKMNKKGQHGASNNQIMTQITRALREKNAPVAFCNGAHWTTIVGISDDNRTFYVVNSLNREAGKIDEVSADSYLNNRNAEFVWLEDIVLDKEGRNAALPENRFHLDKKSGAVITDIHGGAERGASAMSTCGNHVVDNDAHMEYYVPTMIRDYTRKYEQQKAESDSYLKANGGFMPPEPQKPVYTYTSDFSADKVKKELNKQVESNVFGDRKSHMRNAGYFTQEDIDDPTMTPERTDRCYEYIKTHPGCDEIPFDVIYPEFSQNNNAPVAQDNENPHSEERKESVSAPAQREDEFTLFGEVDTAAEENNKVLPDAQQENEYTLFQEEAQPVNKSDSDDVKKESVSAVAQDENEFTILEKNEPVKEEGNKSLQNSEKTVPSVESETENKNNSLDDSDDFSVHESAEEIKEDDLEIYADSNPAQTETEKDYTVIIADQRKSILQCAKLLKSSKTLVNSKEYNDLIGLMEMVGNGKIKPVEGKDAREQFAQELYAIHVQTEKYLEHKAKDGVKRNTYRKLLAVEKTNSMLEKCIGELGDVKVTTAKGKEKGLLELPVSLADRQMRAGTNFATVTNSIELANKFIAKNSEYKKVNSSVIAEGIRSVDICMCEIMIKAHMNNDQSAMKSLEAVRQNFLNNPFPPVKEAAEASVQPKRAEKTI